MWAAAENHADVVRVLIAGGADPNARSMGGVFTPFLFAVRGGQIAAARALLDAGVDVNSTLADGTSALTLATMNAHYELGAMLLIEAPIPRPIARDGRRSIRSRGRAGRTMATTSPARLPPARSTARVRAHPRSSRRRVNARQTKEPRDGNRNMLNRLGATPSAGGEGGRFLPLMKTLLELGADPTIRS